MQKTLNDFWAVVASKAVHPAYANHRYGEIVYNTLYAFNPALAERVTLEHPLLDPFYLDIEAIADSPMFVAFCTYLEENWNNYG